MSYEVEVKARDMEVNDRMQDYVTSKAEKLDRYLGDIQKVAVELTHAKTARQAGDRYIAQITLRVRGDVLRAEERSDEIYNSFDTALDKLQRRIERYKGKRFRGRGDGVSVAEAAMQLIPKEEEPEDEPDIVRRKKFTLMPMDEFEAIEQMKMLGHEDFFVFYNMDTAAVNVLYRRREGGYGLIETELG
jgi:putative sigma-54 modulation protein